MPRQLSRRPRPAEDYEEEEQPRQRSLRSSSGSSRDGNRPKSRSNQLAEEDQGLLTSGWGGYSRMKQEAPSKWEKLYKPPENEEGLIKFLEDGPYANVLQHWIDEAKGQKGFFCLGSQNDCPLCEIGDVPTAYVRFNILDLSGDDPVIMVYQTGITMTEAIKKFADGRMGPLSNPDLYFAATTNVTGKGSKGTRRQSIRPVKSRDLADDFDFDPPLDDDEIAKWLKRCWTKDSIRNSTREELEAIADSLSE